jgi:hypothetical protein
MCNEELQNMYSFHRILCDQIKEGAMGEGDSIHGRHDHYILNFSHESAGKLSVRKVRNKWLGSVKMDVWGVMRMWIGFIRLGTGTKVKLLGTW